MSQNLFVFPKVKQFTENLEHYVFWTSDNDQMQLHILKVEILHQINNFPMNITASEFFELDRQLLGNVGSYFRLTEPSI